MCFYVCMRTPLSVLVMIQQPNTLTPKLTVTYDLYLYHIPVLEGRGPDLRVSEQETARLITQNVLCI